MFTCTFIYLRACIRTHSFVLTLCVTYITGSVYTYIHTYIHIYIHSYIHTLFLPCVQMNDCFNGATHGPVHIKIGGAWGEGDTFAVSGSSATSPLWFLRNPDKLLLFKVPIHTYIHTHTCMPHKILQIHGFIYAYFHS
jgi:hypothetical protein